MKRNFFKIIATFTILATFISSNIGSSILTAKAMNVKNAKQENITVLEEKNENSYNNSSLEIEGLGKNSYSPLYNIDIVPSVLPYLNINDTKQLEVVAILKDGTQRNLTNDVKYSSDKPDVVSVDEKGLLNAKNSGKAKIEVHYEKLVATTCVVVLNYDVSQNIEAHELNINEVNKAISDIKSMYDKFDGDKVYRYNVLLGFGLMDINEKNMSKISSRINLYASDDLNCIAKNIMALVSSNKDPKDYVDKILTLGEAFYDNKSADSIASAVLALDMVNADYDVKKAIKALLDKGYVENNLMYYSSVEETAEVLKALAFHQEIDGVKGAINKIKNCLKLQQCPDGMIKEHTYEKNEEDCSATAKVVSALVALGEDPNSIEWTKMDGNKPNSLIDGIIECNYGDGKFRKEPYDQYFISGTYSADVFQAFNEIIHKRSAYTLRYIPQNDAAKICVYDGEKEINSLELKELEEKELTLKTFDEKGNIITNNEFLWEIEDKSIAEVTRGIVKGIKAGNTKIIIKIGREGLISKEIPISIKTLNSENADYKKVISELENNLSQFYLNNKNYSGKLMPIPVYTLMALNNFKIQFDSNRYKPTKINSQIFISEETVLNNTLGSYILGKEYEIFSKKLSDFQMDDGRFSKNFSKGSMQRTSDVKTQANSIWALDLVKQPYKVNEAVRELLYYAKDIKNFKTVQDTALALVALSEHKDIDGVNQIIKSSLEYIKACQKETGGFADNGKKESAEIDAVVIRGLIANGEDIFSDKWTNYGNNPVDGITEFYNGIDFSKAKSGDLPIYSDKVLFALTQIEANDDEPHNEEKTCKVNISIVVSKDGKYDCMFKPQQVTISYKSHQAGFTALGALQAATASYTMNGDMVTSINEIENQGMNGWKYTVNGITPNKMAPKVEVKEEDKIIWYYSMSGMGGHIPTWEELIGEKVVVTGVKIDKENIILKEGEALKLTATITPQNATNNNLSWSSGDANIAIVDENGSITGIKQGSTTITVITEDGKKTAKCNVEVKVKEEIKPKDYANEVNVSIEAVLNIVLKNNIGDWHAASLSALGRNVPESYLKDITEKIKSKESSLFKAGKFKTPTGCERTIIGIVAAGGDPRNIGSYNLIEDLCSRDLKNESNIYALIYGLIALDSGNFKLTNNSMFTRDDLVNKIIGMEDKNGGWGWDSIDVDTTAMVLVGLSNYMDKSDVKTSVDKAIVALSKLQNENGGYTSEWEKKDTSESTSQVILALCALGIDPTWEKFTNGEKNLMDALFSFKTEDGGFAHTNDNLKTYEDTSTEQAFGALAAYKRFKSGKTGSIYLYKEFKDDIKNEKEIDIRNLTFQKEFKLDSEAKVNIQVINNYKENKSVTFIIALFDDKDNMVKYVAVKNILKPQDISELEGIMKLPKEGAYKVKSFVWDDFTKRNVLSDEIVIPVVE